MLDESSSSAKGQPGTELGHTGTTGQNLDQQRPPTGGRPAQRKSALDELDEDIATLEEKMRKLKDRRKEALKAQRAKNEKALLDLVRANKWEDYPPETWASIASELDKLLKGAVASAG